MSVDRRSAVQDEHRVEQREALSTPATGSAAGRSSVRAINATVTSQHPSFAAAQKSAEGTSSQREQEQRQPLADTWAGNESPPGSMQTPSVSGAEHCMRTSAEEAKALRLELEEQKIVMKRLEQKTLEMEERVRAEKAVEWLTRTDRCGTTPGEYFASTRNLPPSYGRHRETVNDSYPEEYGAWQRAIDAPGAFGNMAPRVGQRTENIGTGSRFDPHHYTHYPQHAPGHYTSPYQPTLNQSQLSARQSTSRELPEFTGSVEHWPMFISNYEHSTAICGYSDDENLLRLQKALKGAARESVGHLILLPTGLREAMAILKARYGRPELIVEAMAEKVRSMPAPRSDRLDTLVDFGFAVRSLCATARATGLPDYMCNVALLRELTSKLPADRCVEWARYKRRNPNVTLSDFGHWIGELAEDLSAVIPAPPDRTRHQPERRDMGGPARAPRFYPSQPTERQHFRPPQQPFRTTSTMRINTHTSGNTVSNPPPTCILCDGWCRSLVNCDRFLGTTVAARRAFVNERRLCKLCLGYHGGKCGVRAPCGENGCTTKHHKLLHQEAFHCNTHSGIDETALLKYVPVTLHGPSCSIDTYALLDDGSTATFMDHALTEELGLHGTPHPLSLQWTGDVRREEKDSVRVAVKISGRHDAARVHEMMDVHTVSKLALPAQSVSVPQLAARYTHLKGIPIASYREVAPRVLIGVDNCRLGQALKNTEGRCDEPIASKTRLGWIVYGPCALATVTPGSTRKSYHIQAVESEDDRLTAAVKDFFSLESAGIVSPLRELRSKEEERALMLLDRETILKGNSYETGLLWRYDDVQLPCNKDAALKRYRSLKAKMRKNPELADAVTKKMTDYVEKGYIRRLTVAEQKETTRRDWYLPIFPVTNPNKPGKIRMVFDAAAEVSGTSLNSFLLAGPDLVAGLLSVLHKFREFRVAIVGDIREMFHQVGIKPRDQRSQMIFWEGDDSDGDPVAYVVTVMTFGAACSPTCAQYVKNRNAERFEEAYPRAVDCIKNEHYVDDMLASVETDEEALSLARTVRHIHARGGFEIRNWISNSPGVVKQLETNLEKEKHVNLGSTLITEKVLGMWWDTSADTFTFRPSSKHDEKLTSGELPATKRRILRTLMSVYDPMGLLGNFLIFLKVLLQEIWRTGYGWDEEIDSRLAEKWLLWVHALPDVQKVRVPRCYRQCTSKLAHSIQLHIFCDASESAMAAVAYLRFEEEESIECALVGSKTRVAPLRFLSIPRMELQAAVIGARLADTISRSHRMQINRVTFWTDSRNVMSWLNSDHRRYNQFVAFRVGELLETTNTEQWRWIPTKLNVADEGTKWTGTPDLAPTTRWFRGPSFLWEPESVWPATETPSRNTTEEIRPHLLLHTVAVPLLQFQRFSEWKSLLKVAAYVVRFVKNIRRRLRRDPPVTGPLTYEEFSEAESIIMMQIQKEAYPREFRSLRNDASKKHPWKKSVDKNSPLYKLSPVIDDRGIIRMRGRLADCSGIDEMTRQPIILPRNHAGTDLLIRNEHERWKHCNHQTVINELRAKFYIPRLLGEYSRIRKTCQRCKNDSAEPLPPSMGNIPLQRIAVGQRAFSFAGIDYFGPILVAVGRRVEKRWGVIFTCLTTRAVHLEVAHSLNTASCIMAIRRFIARRGTPLEMISDRGTNFVGAARELEEASNNIHYDEMMTAFCGPATKWTFNPPAAPHFGGCWERLVRSVKKVLGQFDLPRRPTDEVLQTTLAEIELIINSRPLTYVPLDDEMDLPITPNHLLLGSSDGSKPATVYTDEPAALRSSWRATQLGADWFWRKWVAEYLPTLTRRSKWFESARPIEVGDVVVIVDGNLPRNHWPKGRVVAVVRATDGQVGRATVQTASGVYERPATKLAVLDVRGTVDVHKDSS